MSASVCRGCDRRCFIRAGIGTAAWAAAPAVLPFVPGWATAAEPEEAGISAVVRPPTLFAGIRKPITERAELEPRVKALEAACGTKIDGPLTHIFRFDTPVEGYDSEIGFPVSAPVEGEGIATHTLREMHFYRRRHDGPVEELRTTARSLYAHMNTTGLSPELELVEVYGEHKAGRPPGGRVEVMASFLAWPEVYRAQLERVLGPEAAAAVWAGGEALTPHTPVDPRCAWVGVSLERLKAKSTTDQQFDILSRVALVRPPEEVAVYRALYQETGEVASVINALHEKSAKGRTGGFVDMPRCGDGVLHDSKVPYNREGYDSASTQRERRKAYCFCNLIREAEDPKVDPIFCYRAAGWARQLWEPVLGVEFSSCTITHSVLKGDGFCAWDYRLPEGFAC